MTEPLPIICGGIYWVPKKLIRFAGGKGAASPPERRLAIVVSGDQHNDVAAIETVLLCPISKREAEKTPLCVQIGPPEPGLRLLSWVRIAAVQSLMKSDFIIGSEYLGAASSSQLLAVQSALVDYMGLL
jgi:mRNA-degrading endonuclease toxin of MazEF toxin-antitoxin module